MTTPARRRGPYAKTAEQRRRILEVAVEVFGRLGNRGSSLREIADKVGMSQAGVLHHFGSKTGLLLAVLEQRDEAAGPAADTLVGASAQLRELLHRAGENRGLTQLFTTISAEATDPEHPARAFVVGRYERTVGIFRDAILAAQAQGEARPDVDATALARLMVAAMDGLQLQQLLDEEVDPMPAFDLLLDALAHVLPPSA